MSEVTKLSNFFNLPVNELVMNLGGSQTRPINCDGVTEFQAIDTAVNAYDSNQELIKQLNHKVSWFEHFACKTCGGSGSVGNAPDDYFDCPDCVGKMEQEERKTKALISSQQEKINALTEVINHKHVHSILDWAICGISTNSSSGTEGRYSRMKVFYEFKKSLVKASSIIETPTTTNQDINDSVTGHVELLSDIDNEKIAEYLVTQGYIVSESIK